MAAIVVTSLFLLSAIAFSPVAAQTISPVSTPNLTTPAVSQKPTYPLTIPLVGTCDSWAACRRLCADPVHVKNCRTWAEGLALVKPPPDEAKVIEAARAALGCNSLQECAAFCNNELNRDNCSDFARKNRLGGGYDRMVKRVSDQLKTGSLSTDLQAKIMDELKLLKCDSPTPGISPAPGTCGLAVACARSDNHNVCAKIAEKIGLPGGEIVRDGPGGCRTRESCLKYCADPANARACGRHKSGTVGPPTGATGTMRNLFEHRLRPAPRDRVGPTGATGIGVRTGEQAPLGTTGINKNYEDGRFRPPSTNLINTNPSPKVIIITATPPPAGQQSTISNTPKENTGFTGYMLVERLSPTPTPKPPGVLGTSIQAPSDLPRVPDENPWSDFWRRVFWQ